MKKINIDDRLSDLRDWLPYKKELCESCVGTCCYMPVEIITEDLLRMQIFNTFHLELSINEQIKEALKNSAIKRYTPSSQKFTLVQKPDGSCFYLDKKGRCSIYDLRPNTCRNHPRIGPKPNFCAYIKKS